MVLMVPYASERRVMPTPQGHKGLGPGVRARTGVRVAQ